MALTRTENTTHPAATPAMLPPKPTELKATAFVWRDPKTIPPRKYLDRRIAIKSHPRAKGSQCFCDECEGLMAEGLVYGPDDGFNGWGGND
jgi:hypothetical protein